MLRALRRGDPMAEPLPPARVIGIDDFAWRRGHNYGSIVVDLERRQVIDLLPDRQRETVVAWLRENPQVEIICSDRGPSYVAAATDQDLIGTNFRPPCVVKPSSTQWNRVHASHARACVALRHGSVGARRCRTVGHPLLDWIRPLHANPRNTRAFGISVNGKRLPRG